MGGIFVVNQVVVDRAEAFAVCGCMPVTSWNGRVETSFPAAATPITTDWPHPCEQLTAITVYCYLMLVTEVMQGSWIRNLFQLTASPIKAADSEFFV